MIEYNQFSKLKFEEIEFRSIRPSSLESPSPGNFFSVGREFVPILRRLLLIPDSQKEFYIDLIVRRDVEPNQTLVFNYQADGIDAIELDVSAEFHPWIDSLISMFPSDGSVRINLDEANIPRGGGWNPSELTNTPGAYFRRCTPKRFTTDRDAYERSIFLESFEATDSMHQEFDVAILTELWTRLLRGRKVVAGLGPRDFSRFKFTTGFELPLQLQAIFAISNGAESAVPYSDSLLDLMDLDEVLTCWKQSKAIFDEHTIQELCDSTNSDQTVTIGIRATPCRIPFAKYREYGYLGIDLMPGKDGKIGQVVRYGDDGDKVAWEAYNLTDFLKCSAES